MSSPYDCQQLYRIWDCVGHAKSCGTNYKHGGDLTFDVDSQNVLFTHIQFSYGGNINLVLPEINADLINMQMNY